eukprot:2294720-Pyramimonas_sp.AAC.1
MLKFPGCVSLGIELFPFSARPILNLLDSGRGSWIGPVAGWSVVGVRVSRARAPLARARAPAVRRLQPGPPMPPPPPPSSVAPCRDPLGGWGASPWTFGGGRLPPPL